ncbi:MAG: pyridoxal-phosphate dependent enzyme [Desulfurococcaceae archaeon]
MKFVDVEELETKTRLLPLEEYIELLEITIRKWKTRPLMLGKSSSPTEEDSKLFSVLWSLGTRYVPIADHTDEMKLEVSLDELDVFHNVRGNPVRVYDSVVSLVAGDLPTPLVKLKSLSNSKVRVWAKLEWYHPFSLSIKDRTAWYMLVNAIKTGYLSSGKTIYEPTSANTGLGLVGLANYYGLKIRVYLPYTTQKCMDYVFATMGAEVVRKNVPITTAKVNSVLLEAARDGAVVLNQFENDLNFIVHLKYTAKEIDYQLRSVGVKPSAIIGGLGTSGHVSAISVYFKNRYENVKVFAVQPSGESSIPGIRRVETGMKWLRTAKIDKVVDVSLEEAFQGIIHVARKDGILIGFSGGAVIYALNELIESGEVEGDVVAVIPDHGVKYIELMQSLLTKACPDAPYSG